MEKLNKLTFNGNDYISKKDLLKFLAEISDAVNTFSDRGDPIRAEGANKVISLMLEKIEPPQEHWKPSEGQMEALYKVAYNLVGTGTETDVHLVQLYEQLKQLWYGTLHWRRPPAGGDRTAEGNMCWYCWRWKKRRGSRVLSWEGSCSRWNFIPYHLSPAGAGREGPYSSRAALGGQWWRQCNEFWTILKMLWSTKL